MSVIDDVKQKTDIIEVVSQYTNLTKSGRTFRGLCPFHSEKRPSFFVYPEQQSWHCFGACNTGGDVFSFIMKKQSIDFGEALHLLAQRAGVTVPSKSEPDARKEEKERLYQANEAAAQYFHDTLNSTTGEPTRNYLASRAFTLKTITDFQLGFSPNSWEALKQYLLDRGYTESELLEAGLLVSTEDGKTHDRFRNRLMFPIKDARGRIIGFGGRVLDDSLPKYLNSPQTPVFDKSGNLYGINLAAPAIRQKDMAVIVEGYMDAITAHQNDFTNVVASMGTAVTERQVSTLKRMTRNITLALDADAAGEEAMLRCVEYENSLGGEVKVIVLPGGRDPDDVIKEDAETWQRLIEEALPAVDYKLNMTVAKLDLTAARDKSLAIDQLMPVIGQIRDDIRRDHYLTRLSKLTGVSYNKLEAVLKSYLTQQKTKKPVEEPATRSARRIFANPLEEDCLTLLLQHPELKNWGEGLLPEYFENSENREIFLAWQEADDPSTIEEKIDPSIQEHLDSLRNKSLPPNMVELRYADYTRRLKEKHFKSVEAKRAEVFAYVAESEGTGADLAKLEEEGIETALRLRETFIQARRGREQRR